MKRPYTTSEYKNLVDRIHKKANDAAIGLDVIVGFPTETAELFEETYEFLEALNYSYAHVFSFSPRKNTPAALLKPVYRTEDVRERSRRLIELSANKKKAFADSLSGSKQRIIIERGHGERNNISYGVTDNYMTVYFDEQIPAQSVVYAKLAARKDEGFTGEII